MRRIAGLLLALLLIALLAYLSRFWIFEWWGREGLFGIEELRRGGDLWRRWMNGFGLGSYDLILWAVGGFIVLSIAQKLWDALTPHE